jgi:hypothetical protein
MAFDRSKFQATSVATLKEQEQATEAVAKNSGFEKTEYHKHGEGENIYRIYPAHPEALTQAFAFARCTHYIECEVPTQDKKGTELKKKHLFNAKIHGNYPKDIIEEYIQQATDLLNGQKLTAAALKNRLFPITDYRDGIKPQVKWMMYADKMIPGNAVAGKISYAATFGILELSQAQKDRLNVISQNESAGEVIATDPFTNPDTGRAVIIRKKTLDEKGQKVAPKDMYQVEMDSAADKQTFKVRLFPLSDSQLESFAAKELLEKRYTNCYKRSDFERAVGALELFDSKHEYGVFGTERWNATVMELDAMIPADDETEEGEAEGDEGAPRGDKFSRMNRDDLKSFIRTERLGIVPSQSMTDDNMRDLIRQKLSERNVPAPAAPAPSPSNSFPNENEELGDDTSDGGQRLANLQDARDAERETPAATAPKTSSRMAALKEKVGATN